MCSSTGSCYNVRDIKYSLCLHIYMCSSTGSCYNIRHNKYPLFLYIYMCSSTGSCYNVRDIKYSLCLHIYMCSSTGSCYNIRYIKYSLFLYIYMCSSTGSCYNIRDIKYPLFLHIYMCSSTGSCYNIRDIKYPLFLHIYMCSSTGSCYNIRYIVATLVAATISDILSTHSFSASTCGIQLRMTTVISHFLPAWWHPVIITLSLRCPAGLFDGFPTVCPAIEICWHNAGWMLFAGDNLASSEISIDFLTIWWLPSVTAKASSIRDGMISCIRCIDQK